MTKYIVTSAKLDINFGQKIKYVGDKLIFPSKVNFILKDEKSDIQETKKIHFNTILNIYDLKVETELKNMFGGMEKEYWEETEEQCKKIMENRKRIFEINKTFLKHKDKMENLNEEMRIIEERDSVYIENWISENIKMKYLCNEEDVLIKDMEIWKGNQKIIIEINFTSKKVYKELQKNPKLKLKLLLGRY